MQRPAIPAMFLVLCLSAVAAAVTTDDLVFIHHSCGRNWLNNSLHAALLAKDYIDERNDIYYSTDATPDAGRPDSLAPYPGDRTDMNHWVRWFNDYLQAAKSHGCASGVNRIIMFKSCYPASNITTDGTGGDPFSSTKSLANYKAVYRHPDGPGHTYSYGGYTYKPLEDIFAENPETLFIPVTAPPRHYAPSDATNDAEAHRARVFNNWLKTDWLNAYNAANPGLNNVAVFDWFNVLAYADDHSTHPNRLKSEYGGTSGDSHPNSTANNYSTQVFATNTPNFIDDAWDDFMSHPPVANNDAYDVLQDTTLVVPAPGVLDNDTDADGDPLQAIKLSDPAHGDLFFDASGNGAFTYVPDPGYYGPDGFTYKANDGTYDSNTAFVSITVLRAYTLTVNSGSGSGQYAEHEVVAIVADPPPAHTRFWEWTGDTAGIAETGQASTTITMPAADAAVTAEYRYTGDLDGNGRVGQTDLDIVLDNWGLPVPPADPRADASGDDYVGQIDLDYVLDTWGCGY